jgi:hypothetical protein
MLWHILFPEGELHGVQGEGVITDYRALGTLPGDQLDGAPVDAVLGLLP